MTRVFESVIDATRAGLGCGEDWQFLGEGSGDVGGGQLSCLPGGRIAHDAVPDDHLGAGLEVQQGGDVVRNRTAGHRGRLDGTPALGGLVEVVAEFVPVHQARAIDTAPGWVMAHDRAPAADRLDQALGGQLGDGAPDWISPVLCTVINSVSFGTRATITRTDLWRR